MMHGILNIKRKSSWTETIINDKLESGMLRNQDKKLK
jgi:hypothetical protein